MRCRWTILVGDAHIILIHGVSLVHGFVDTRYAGTPFDSRRQQSNSHKSTVTGDAKREGLVDTQKHHVTTKSNTSCALLTNDGDTRLRRYCRCIPSSESNLPNRVELAPRPVVANLDTACYNGECSLF